jgi:membrane protein YqaA with SNARE-associated domain
MKRRNQIILILFAMIMIVLALLVIINTENVELMVRQGIQKYGLGGVLFFSFIADLFMQPFGPEMPGLFAILANLKFPNIYLATVIGSTLGGLVSFFIGRHFLLQRINIICQIGKYKNYCKLFSKYGRWGLLLAAITPIPFVLFCWLSGAFHMKIKNFVIFGLVPRAFRIGFYLGLAWVILA